MNDISNILSFFLETQLQLKILHWQTSKYSEHKAYDKAYKSLDELIDSFVETYQGKNKKIFLNENDKIIALYNIKDKELNNFIEETVEILNSEVYTLLSNENKDGNSDLLAIKDEMLIVLNRLNYLIGF